MGHLPDDRPRLRGVVTRAHRLHQKRHQHAVIPWLCILFGHRMERLEANGWWSCVRRGCTMWEKADDQ